MSNGYNFYFQRYNSKGDGSAPKIDIEENFNCKYCSMTNLSIPGDIKNIYTEDYAEANGVRIYVPKASDIVYSSTECTLTLLMQSATCESYVRNLLEYLHGYIVEYSDTFRNRYATLVLQKAITIKAEKLYAGNDCYQHITVPFTNIYGRSFSSSQIDVQPPATEKLLLENGSYVLLES